VYAMRVSSPPEERGTGAGLEDIIGGGDAPQNRRIHEATFEAR
jgi:hypothetical protein